MSEPKTPTNSELLHHVTEVNRRMRILEQSVEPNLEAQVIRSERRLLNRIEALEKRVDELGSVVEFLVETTGALDD